VTGGNTFDNGTDYWNWYIVVCITILLKTTKKKKIEEEVLQTPMKKRKNAKTQRHRQLVTVY
jgi:hypothetical protein